MKQGWEIKKLGDVCSIQLGKTPYRKNPKFWDKGKVSGNVWLSIADLKHGEYITDSAEQVSDLGAKDIVKIPKGTMLLSFKLTLGRVSFAGVDLYTNEAIAALLNLDKKLSKDFLFYYFSLFDWDKTAEGDIKVKGKTLNKQKLKELQIIVPPLTEQKRLVAILDEAFAAIDKTKANAEQNLKNAKELFESYLQDVFENGKEIWEEKILDEVCEFRNGAAHEQHIDENGKFILVNSKFISADGEKFKRTNNALAPLYVNDIAFVMSDVPNGKALAKCFLVDKDDTYSLNQRIGAIKSDVFVPEFLVYQFNRNKFLLSFNNGENQTNLRKGDILSCPLWLPSKQEQKNIVRQLNALRAETQKLESVYQKKMEDLEEMKKSILQKAFAGELETEK
jgi:type I restriction enzyme S subunit